MPILVLLTEKLEILRQSLGQRRLCIASLDDIEVWAGLHFIVGTFLAGAVTHAAWFDREEVGQFRGVVAGLEGRGRRRLFTGCCRPRR